MYRDEVRIMAEASRVEQGHDPGRVAAAHRLGIDEARRANALAFEGQKKADLAALCRRQRPKLQYLGFARRQHDPFTTAEIDGAECGWPAEKSSRPVSSARTKNCKWVFRSAEGPGHPLTDFSCGMDV